MNEPGRGEYVTYREHMAAREEAQKRLQAVEMEQATMRAALMHLPDDVRELTQAVNALGNRVAAPAADSNALAMHHLATEMKAAMVTMQQRPNLAAEIVHGINSARGSQSGVGLGTMILIGFSMFGVGVACLWLGKVFL